MPVVADIDRSPHSEPDSQKTTGARDQLAFPQRALSDCAALEFVARGEARIPQLRDGPHWSLGNSGDTPDCGWDRRLEQIVIYTRKMIPSRSLSNQTEAGLTRPQAGPMEAGCESKWNPRGK